jgi:hypothetical protein
MGLQLETLLAATRVAGVKVADWTNIIQTRLKEEAAKANTGNAVRGGTVPTVYHTSAALAARPIDALGGSIVTKAPGQHVTAGVPIEIRVGGANPTVFNNTGGAGDADEGSSDEDEDDDEEEEDEDMAEEDDEEEQHKQQAAEMAQAAQKLQAKHQQQQQQQPKAAKQHAKK